MRDNWKKVVLIALIVIVLGTGIYIAVKVFMKENSIKYNDEIANVDNILSQQDYIDQGIKEAMDNEEFTFDSPYVQRNPYLLSPLTAIIVFQTSNEVKYDVYINDTKFTTTEKSNKHSIPIYGLVAGKDNKVKLVGSDNKTKEITLTTDKFDIGMKIDKNAVANSNNWYFLAGISTIGHIAVNTKGEVVWYLTSVGAQDIEFLSNGHMLICNNESAGSESFTGFYEIDYLGKIYKTYALENAYHHEVNELKDGNLLVAGEKENSMYKESYIYTIDKDSGKEIKSLDLYDVISKVDSNYASTIRGKDLIVNSLYYDENNDQLIISIRGLNTVMSVNYSSKNINWMLASKNDWSDAFDKYILKSADGSRLPLGQHSAFLTESGQLGLLNNDYDPNEIEKVLVKDYVNDYSSATIYDINENNKTFRTVWNYIDDDKVFNYALSSFNISDDNHRIVNFGWSFVKSAYQNDTSVIYDELKETYSRIVELDENSNILFRASIKNNLYRVFKHNPYVESMNNYTPSDLVVINTIPYTVLEQVSTLSIQSQLSDAEESEDEISFKNNTLDIKTLFGTKEEVKIVFKSDLISYIFNYKPRNKSINNKLNLSIRGKYDIYLIVNDTYYKTNSVLDASGKTLVIKSA